MTKKILLIILFSLIISGCGARANMNVEMKNKAIPVKVTTVKRGNLAEVFSIVGTIEAKRQANISAKVPGRVAEVHVQLGDYVTANQLLVELEKSDFQNQNKQAKALLAQAEVNYKQSKDNYERMQKLFAEKLISQQQFDAAQMQFEVAEAQLKQAQAGAEVSDSQLNNTEIRAPFSGYIGFCKVNPGEIVAQGIPLMSVVDLSKVYVLINLSDSYIGQIKKGQKVQVSLQAYPDDVFSGKVVQIAPAADMMTKTFPIRIEVDNQKQKCKAGMLAHVKFNFNERKDVLQIPAEAVIDEIGNKAVYVIQGNIARRKVITPGITDGKMLEVVAGLKADEKVVIIGQSNLSDGTKVVVK